MSRAARLGERCLVLLGRAWPLTVSGQLASLVRIASSAWVGKLVGVTGLAVVSVAFPIENASSWLFMIISQGCGVLVARATGAGESVRPIIRSALSLSLLGVLVVCAAGWVWRDPLIAWLVGERTDLRGPFATYFTAWLGALPFSVVAMLLLSAVVSTGRTYFGLVRVLLDLVLVASLTPVFTSTLGMGIAGPPITSGVGSVLLILSMTWVVGSLRGQPEPALPTTRLWGSMLRIGAPIQIARIASWLSHIAIMGIVIRQSPGAAAGIGVAMTLVVTVNVLTLSVARATSIFAAQSLGRGDFPDAEQQVQAGLVVTIVVTLGFAALAFAARPIVAFMAQDPAVTDQAMVVVRWLALSFVGTGVWQLLAEVYTVAKRAQASAAALIVLDLVALGYVWLSEGPVLERVCVAHVANQLARALALGALYRSSFSSARLATV